MNNVEYSVPDSIWHDVVAPHNRDACVCLNCFIELADAKFVPWDIHVQVNLSSMASRLKSMQYQVA